MVFLQLFFLKLPIFLILRRKHIDQQVILYGILPLPGLSKSLELPILKELLELGELQDSILIGIVSVEEVIYLKLEVEIANGAGDPFCGG